MTAPVIRVCVDWDDDGMLCVNSISTDALNRMHTGLSSDPGYVNLHWNSIHTSAINSSTVTTIQGVTEYGIRQLNCVTGTNTTAGAYFGRTGSTNDFSVSNATTYTATFWIKATVGSGTGLIISMENSTGSTGFTVTGSWVKVSRTFTTTGTTTAFKIVKNSSATNVTFQVSGFMIVTGSTAPTGFNVGHSTNVYDVITNEVKAWDADSGKRNWLATEMDEGTAHLTLDNSSRRYSPEYSGGPLYTYMKQRLLITIDIQDPVTSAYTRKWSGFIGKYEPMPGQHSAMETRLTCEQAKWQLDRIQYTAETSGTFKSNELIEDVLLAGWLSAATPLQAVANRARANACYATNKADIMTLDTGISDLTVTGETWGEGSSASRVIDECMKVERGFFFVNASGVAKFYNRLHYIDPDLTPSTVVVNLNTDTTKNDYVYGADFYNNIKVTYYPAEESTTETLWESNGIIKVVGRRTKSITAKLEYDTGKKKTASTVNAFDGTVDASTIQVMNGASFASAVTGEIVSNENGVVNFTLHNSARGWLNVRVALKGTSVQSFGGQVVEVTDTVNGIRGGKVTLPVSSKLIGSENQARNLGYYLLKALATAAGQIKAYTMISKSNTMLQNQLNNGIATKVSVSEYQTGHSGTYFVCGERLTWRPGLLEATESLFPLDRVNFYWRLGSSVIGTATYLGY